MDGIIVIHLRLVGGNYFLSSSMISIGSTLGAVQLHYLGFIHLGRALIFQQGSDTLGHRALRNLHLSSGRLRLNGC